MSVDVNGSTESTSAQRALSLKTEGLAIRVAPAELAVLRRAAKANGQGLSAWARAVLLGAATQQDGVIQMSDVLSEVVRLRKVADRTFQVLCVFYGAPPHEAETILRQIDGR